ncbi:MAG: hypothetical protein SPF23_00755 [Paludibacteraceae bacterium]|nr:hypothetical protein [Paludibacteraceae bacterium]
MKKFFITLTMMLLGLFAGVSTLWAVHVPEAQGGYTPEQAVTYGFWAKLTAKPAASTNGSGKVFVVANYNYSEDPEAGDYAIQKSDEDWSDIYLASSLIDADVEYYAYAKANDGSYFTGWSFTDGYTDLGRPDDKLRVKVTPSSKKGHANLREQFVYAAFEFVQLTSYELVSGSQEVTMVSEDNWQCTQTIKFRAETPNGWALSSADDVRHFKLPVITKKTGTSGTWSVGVTEWTTSNVTLYGNYAELAVPVTFTAPNGDAGEYAATLTLETEAGVKLTAYLYARRTVAGAEAIRYNKSKVQQEAGNLTDLLANAAADDIIKLNGNYSDAVSINKDITLDLNGYTISNTLTVSGGNVTLAYSAFGGSANALNVTGGKAILNGGSFSSLTIGESGTVEQNGATFTGAARNNGSLTTTDGKFQGGLTSSKTLVVNGGIFNGDIAINVTGGTAQIKRGTINGTTYGVQSAATTTIEKLATITGGTKALKRTAGTLTVDNGKFAQPAKFADGDIVFKSAYFGDDASAIATVYDKQLWRNTSGVEYREGYVFFVGDQAAAQASNVSVCRIGQTAYASLDEALAYANNHLSEEVIIIMENDYTLKAGYYTIPANATLIVPMSDDQETANPVVPRETNLGSTPKSFRRLTLESGVNMTVLGTVEVTGMQHGSGEQMGVPGGNYGHLILKPGSHVTLSSGSVLRAWGFVTGDGTTDADGNYLSGEIDARRGATVREMFQMGDWKGGDISFTIAMEMPDPSMPNYRDLTHLFPIYTYFIQNVESPVKYHPGSALICATSVNVASSINAYANDIKVVGKEGEAAMFLMDEMADAENTWVRKYYDAKKDQQVYEVNSGAKLGSVVIDLGEVPGTMFGGSGTMKLMLDSRSFVLPLTSNFKIHLLTGYMEFTQSTSCLPGMEVEVDKEAEVALVNDHTPGVAQGALYLYDADQWSFQNSQAKGYVGNFGKFGAIVRYSATLDSQPTVRDISSPAAIGDAKLIVHGTFRSGDDCSVYTSWSKDLSTMGLKEDGTGGASIISTNEDAGTFIFDADAPAFDGMRFEGEDIVGFGPNVIFNYDHNNYNLDTYPLQIQTVLGSTERVYGFELCTPAKLKNADGTFVETDSTKADTSYCYMNDRWTLMKVAEEHACFMKDNYGTFYAKPAEYVAVNATYDDVNYVMVGNADHTFSDKDGAGRLFILMDNCQWWEVEKKDNLYHCIHPNNDTYYYWDDDNKEWKEQRFTITWLNWNGDTIKSYTYDPNTGEPEEVSYSVTYGTQAEFLGSNPTREPNIDYTYDFTGWTPALGKVTSDVTYTATYSKQPRKYTIIFTTEGGVEIERQFLTHNELPVCENVPTKTGFTLQWEPALAAVTRDTTYRATWLEEPPTEYAVTFFDYDGTTKLKPTGEEPYMVAVGTMPTPPADPAGKPATAEFTYVFQHWSPSPEKVSATSIKSYTAVYKEVAKTYEIKYYKEDGTTLISSENLTYGATPTPPAVTKEDPEEGHTYTLVWKTLNEAGTIQTVQGEASYKPTYLDVVNRYTVTLRSNIPGACTLTGAGTYDYNTMVSISATPAEGYEFVRWQETSSTSASLDPQALTADITLTAELRMASLPDLPVGIDAEVTVDTPTDYNDVTITSNGISQSGQIINANNIILHGNADFVLQKPMERLHWYDVAVPWRVDATNGIFLDGSTTPAVLGSDIALYYYDGSVRATQGKVDACWIPVKDQSQKVLEPGRAYLFILYNTAVNQVTFRKQDGASLLTTVTSVAQYDQTTGYPADAGWNGIANPSLFKAYLNAGTTVAQTINAAGDGYEAISADSYLVVGQPIYVQVAASKSPVEANHNSYAAPVRRMNASADPARYQLTITAEGANRHADRLFVQLDEEKEENTYVIGKDLAKFGTSTSSAQMWIDRYDAKLCLNTVAPQGDATSFPMTLSAPKAGEYTIAIEREVSTDAYELYLTYDGTAIWNLSESAYTTNLNQGTDARYGLRIVARTPQICTGVDEAVVDAQGATRKVLVNEKVFIIRGNEVYTIDGQLVK